MFFALVSEPEAKHSWANEQRWQKIWVNECNEVNRLIAVIRGERSESATARETEGFEAFAEVRRKYYKVTLTTKLYE